MVETVDFWLLDINYDVVGGVPEIRMWGIDRSGRRIVVIDRKFRPYFYVLIEDIDEEKLRRIRGSLSVYNVLSVEVVEKKYFGKKIKAVKVTISNPRNVPKAREVVSKLPFVKEVLEADIRFYMRYMVDNDIYPSSWHRVKVERLSAHKDWRVDAVYLAMEPPKHLDDRSLPDLKVYAFDIECYNRFGEPDPDRDPVIIIGRMFDGKLRLFQAKDHDDTELLKNFVEDMVTNDPDVIVGYNSNRF
ncbi:MAG: DNA polymerase II, partial [Thermoprotei archaeon]